MTHGPAAVPENEPTGVNGPLRLASLTSLRFYAALGVVALHSVPILVSPHLLALVDAGQAGVDFFFVLSGFVLTYAARSMSGAVFYWNRFARVWPLHAVMWALALTTFWWLGQSPRGGPAVSTLFLGQAWVDDPTYYEGGNPVSWSLSCEVLFYVLFPSIVGPVSRATRRHPGSALAACFITMTLGAFALTALLDGTTRAWATYDLPVYRLPEFILGIVLASLPRSYSRLVVRPCVAIALLLSSLLIADLLVKVGAFVNSPVVFTLLSLPFVALVLRAFTKSERVRRPRVLAHRWSIRLGEWSYALYLTHYVLLVIVIHLLPSTRSALLGLAEEFGYVGIAIAVSAMAYITFERPVERWLRHRPPRRPPKPGSATAGVQGTSTLR